MSVIRALFYMMQVEVHLRMHIPANMRDPKNFNFNAQHSIKLLFHCNYRKKICRKMVSLAALGTWNLEILQKQNAAI